MRTRAAIALLLLVLCACKPAEDTHSQAIIGAVLIDGAGGPPLSNSVVVVADGRIREAGRHGEIPVSAEISKVDGAGKFLVPALVDIYRHPDPAVNIAAPGPATPDDARARIAAVAANKPAAIHVWPANLKPGIAEAVLEAARTAGIPVTGHPANQAEAQSLVQNGAVVLIGMFHDTDPPDPLLVTHLRDLRIVYAPALSAIPNGPELDRAKRNTQRLFAAGVPLAAAASGGDIIRECELLVESGVPPLDAIVAGTQNGARALGQPDRGAILPGRTADLLLLLANPGEDIRNLRRVARRMTAGAWQ